MAETLKRKKKISSQIVQIQWNKPEMKIVFKRQMQLQQDWIKMFTKLKEWNAAENQMKMMKKKNESNDKEKHYDDTHDDNLNQ